MSTYSIKDNNLNGDEKNAKHTEMEIINGDSETMKIYSATHMQDHAVIELWPREKR